MYRTKSLYTTAGFQVQQNLHWEMLTDDQCEAVLVRALELLERTGFEAKSDAACKIFADAGCRVEGGRVRIPSAKSEWALRVAPSRVTLCDREGNRAMVLETNHVHYGPGFACKQILDANAEAPRDFTIADVEKVGMLVDSLPGIDFAMSGGVPTDVPAKTAEVHAFKALLETTVKPIVQNVKCMNQAKAVYDLAVAAVGSEDKLRWDPCVVLHVAADESLLISGEALDIVAFAAEKGIPVVFSNELIAGHTAPSESAGVLIVALANSIAALVLSQSVAEGAPFITGGFFGSCDVDNQMVPYGAPEVSLLGAGYAGVLRYLRIPSFGFAAATDSKMSDAQLGLESAMSTLTAGLAGTNLIHGAGTVESGCAFSLMLLTLADELAAITRRIMRGVEMDEDRLARGVIDEVEPGGHYLGTLHTRYYFKSEQFWPTLMNRKRIDDWAAEGSLSLGDRTVNKTEDLLNSYQKAAILADGSKEFAAIVDKVDAAG